MARGYLVKKCFYTRQTFAVFVAQKSLSAASRYLLSDILDHLYHVVRNLEEAWVSVLLTPESIADTDEF